jgi:hypothetical protein
MVRRKITKTTDQFTVKDTSGRVIQIFESTTFHDVTTLDSKGEEWLPGLKGYRDAQGNPVNKIDEKTFEDMSSNLLYKE